MPARNLTLLPVCCLFASLALGQNNDNWVAPSTNNSAAPGTQSLADVARKLRKSPTAEVKMTAAGEQELFKSVDDLFAFAAEDTGFPKRSPIKRRLVGTSEVENYVRKQIADSDASKQFAQSEISMKKFGFLPRDFDLRGFLVKASGQQIAGYYDGDTKSISLLNWVPLEQQKPILAHELTHALQDQNYNLKVWQRAGQSPSGSGESLGARHAIVEGQAMIVYLDYVLAPVGRSVKNTPGLIYQMEEPAVKAVADSEMLHSAPIILRESGTFPYRYGLIFEGELLANGGQEVAFAGAFARPPLNSHEVLQPKAYIDREKLAPLDIPDMHAVLGGKYEVYDSGDIGELDLRALLKQYGERKSAEELAADWQGGKYVTYRRASENDPSAPVSAADVALLYVSRWKTPHAAERFARTYNAAIAQRYHTATPQKEHVCGDEHCPNSSSTTMTEEGPVIVELWPDNTVVISESFDETTATQLRDAVRGNGAQAKEERSSLPEGATRELSLRLLELPAFRGFQQQLGEAFTIEMVRAGSR